MKGLILIAVFSPCVLFASPDDFAMMIGLLIFMIPFHLSLSLIAGFSINFMFKFGRKIYLLISLFISVITLLISGIFAYYDVLSFEDKILPSYIAAFVLSVIAAYLILAKYKKKLERNKGKN